MNARRICGGIAIVLALAGCGSEAQETPDAGPPACTLTKAETSGTATVTAASASAPACDATAAALVGTSLPVEGGAMGAGEPLALTSVRSVATATGCTYELAGTATLEYSDAGCSVAVSVTMSVER